MGYISQKRGGDRLKMANRKYKWDEWFMRHRFRVIEGLDYRCSTISMAQQIRNYASSIGRTVSVEEESDGLLVTVILPRTSNKVS